MTTYPGKVRLTTISTNAFHAGIRGQHSTTATRRGHLRILTGWLMTREVSIRPQNMPAHDYSACGARWFLEG